MNPFLVSPDVVSEQDTALVDAAPMNTRDLTSPQARFYDGIYGVLLPLLFLSSLLLSAYAGMHFFQRYQGHATKAAATAARNDQFLHPERSFFQDGERYDVMAIEEGSTAIGRLVLIRRATTGKIESFRIGDRIFGKGPFVA